MKRVSLVAASLVTALAAAAFADEYTVEAVNGGYVTVPALVDEDMTPEEAAKASTLLIDKKTNGLTVTTTLPFDFPFFGNVYAAGSNFVVADDGWIAFGTGALLAAENAPLPSKPSPNAVVAPLWDDLRTKKGGNVVRFVKGAAPSRILVIAWQHMDTKDDDTATNLSFEVLLHETTGVLEFAYLPSSTGTGLSYTSGIENESGTRAFGAPNLDNTNLERPAQGRRFTPNATTVTGTITRDRPVASEDGLGVTTETDLPVAGARVEIVREDVQTRVVVGSALTDADGTFTATVLGLDGAPTLGVDLLAAGDESRVTDASGNTYRRRVGSNVVPAPGAEIAPVHLDGTVLANDPNFMEALNIQQAARRGYAFALAWAAARPPATTTFPQLEMRWVPDSATASTYTAATSTVPARATISDAPVNPDGYDDDVVLREYGQHVLASMAAFPSGSASHLWNTAVGSETVAFADGWSHWFAMAVQGRARFIDTKSATTATVFDLEAFTPPVTVTPPAPLPAGNLVPGGVACSLWDLVDDAAEARDPYAGVLPDGAYDVLSALDQKKGAASLPSGASAWTCSAFFTEWRKSAETAAADHEAASPIFINYRTFADDDFEPNDSAAAAVPFSSPTSRLTGLTLNPSNTDAFSFDLAAQPLSFAVSFTEATEVTASIADLAGNVLASASSGLVRSPVVVGTPPALAPGTYLVLVSWKSGPRAIYTLGKAPQMVLVTASLPDWTAETLFNQPIVVTGGLPPVTLSVAPEAPDGLAMVNPDGRLAGTPTTPGVYQLDIVATDASGSGPQTLGTLQLTINPALELADVFGVVANRVVAADIGKGGTTAVWTPGTQPPAGFALAGGDTLRLTSGNSGPAGSFDVTATATDSIGASLPTTTSHVVVSDPVSAARRAQVAADQRIGFWFDAVEGSRASFDFSFTGGAKAPVLATVVDAAGTKLDFASAYRRDGGHIRITNLLVPKTARYFIVFKASSTASTVTDARRNVRAPSLYTGVVNIEDAAAKADTKFHAIAGGRAKFVLRAAHAPFPATPGSIQLFGPAGAEIPLPPARAGDGGDRLTISGVRMPVSGEYTLRVGGDGQTIGPLVFEISISTPRNAAFSID